MFKTVLFPIDHSRESREAVDTVINLVKTYSSRLVLLSVVEAFEGETATVADRERTSPEAIAQLLTEFKSLFQQQGIDTEAIEREGVPAFVICDVADEVDANLIVMGCRGLGLTEEGASESVTNRVINLAPCAVLVVP
ncbi:universal stress protein [Leptolyngbya ohadii]|uniref:universal stress protein n=1 Tax=Leptolyngbya ohadii TaxID=1962290 RepID=UPI000B5A13E7|nr:universal stress protein [Leptolyngbya ohadii]